jgi:CDGSH-type Zn-finger protein/uncharacterized Fe-S cluster protein YjdI
MSEDKEMVRGTRLVVHFDHARCIHSRHCVLGLPQVFVPNVEGEWIHPDAAAADEVTAVSRSCPSGAITYQRLDGEPDEAPPPVNLVRIRENGPLAFHGALQVGELPPMLRATLCRCGATRHPPFCDNSHTAAGFQATGEPETRPSQPLEQRDGALAVTVVADGPLRLLGNIELVSGTGRTIDRMTKVSLCRCGQSANKPFCDGAHKRVGFRSA